MERLTPVGVAGVAVYRFLPAELPALAGRVTPPTALHAAASGRPVRAIWRLDGGVVDDVLVVATGGGAIEVHAHGGLAIDAAAVATFGVVPAAAPAAAAELLRAAIGRAQLALALEQAGHDFDAEVAQLAAMPLAARATAVACALARSRIAMAIVAPCPLHLVGRQNAGKSTLFNQLLGRERSLAGAEPGLTRDAVAETVTLEGYPYVLHDHAGEGAAPDPADVAAIARSRVARRQGSRILVVDGAIGPSGVDRELAAGATLVVASKGDLPAATWPADVPCAGRCAPRSEPMAELQRRIGGWLRAARGLPPAGPVGGFAALDEAQFERLRALAGVDA